MRVTFVGSTAGSADLTVLRTADRDEVVLVWRDVHGTTKTAVLDGRVLAALSRAR